MLIDGSVGKLGPRRSVAFGNLRTYFVCPRSEPFTDHRSIFSSEDGLHNAALCKGERVKHTSPDRSPTRSLVRIMGRIIGKATAVRSVVFDTKEAERSKGN